MYILIGWNARETSTWNRCEKSLVKYFSTRSVSTKLLHLKWEHYSIPPSVLFHPYLGANYFVVKWQRGWGFEIGASPNLADQSQVTFFFIEAWKTRKYVRHRCGFLLIFFSFRFDFRLNHSISSFRLIGIIFQKRTHVLEFLRARSTWNWPRAKDNARWFLWAP